MRQLSKESIVSLDHLDSYLKTILKLKIREFVHLSPWFKDVDTTCRNEFALNEHRGHRMDAADCPNQDNRIQRRRRQVQAQATFH